MKTNGKKTIKIFGITAAALMLIVIFHPLVYNINSLAISQIKDNQDDDFSEPTGIIDFSQPSIEDSFFSKVNTLDESSLSIPGISSDLFESVGADSLGPDSVGPGLHVEIATGNVHTELNICDGFSLNYNSLKYYLHDGTPLGSGWTHNNNMFVIPNINSKKLGGTSPPLYRITGSVEVIDGQNMMRKYIMDEIVIGPGYSELQAVRPAGATADLIGIFINGNFQECQLKYFDGSLISFSYRSPTSGYIYYITKYVNQFGQIKRFEYMNGRLVKIINPYGQTITLQYYSNQNLKTVTDDQTGETTTFMYTGSSQNLLWKVIDPLGNNVEYGYESTYPFQYRLNYEKLKNGVTYTCHYSTTTREIYVINPDLPPGQQEERVLFVFAVTGFPFVNRIPTIADRVRVVDGNGIEWVYHRDAGARRTRVITPDGYTTSVTYVGNTNWVGSVTNALGNLRKYYYDIHGNEGYGNIIQIENYKGTNILLPPLSSIEYFFEAPNPFHKAVTKVKMGDAEWSATYYDVNDGMKQGRLKTVTDPTGHTTTYDYTFYNDNPLLPGRLKTKTIIDRNNHQTVYEYDSLGCLTKKTISDIDNPAWPSIVEEYEYYPDTHRLLKTITHRSPVDDVITQYTYDATGRMLSETIDPLDSNPNGLNLVTSWTFDGNGNLLTVTNSRGVVTKYLYDYRNRLTDIIKDYTENPSEGINAVTKAVYDGNNNIVEIKDPEFNSKIFEYDAQNWLEKITDAEGYITRLTRNEVGMITKIQRWLTPGTETGDCFTVAYEYDALNRVIKKTVDPIPENGNPLDYLNLITQYTYTQRLSDTWDDGVCLQSQVETITDAENHITTYIYHPLLNRLTQVKKQLNNQDILWQIGYDNEGNIRSLDGPEGERTEYVYDAADRLIRKHQEEATLDLDLVTLIDYDGAGNVKSVTLPNNNVITRMYDKADRLLQESDSLGQMWTYNYDNYDDYKDNGKITATNALGKTWTAAFDTVDREIASYDPGYPDISDLYEYDRNDQLVLHTNKNDVKTKYEYNALGWIIKKTRDFDGTDPNTANTKTDFVFNGLGLVTAVKDHNDHTTRYIYDAAAQLKTIVYPDDPDGTGDDHTHMDYDNVGNLRYRTDQNGYTTEFVYDDLYRLTNIIHPDISGDLYPEIAGMDDSYTDHYTYDNSDRLKTASNPWGSWEFQYDKLGRLDEQKQIVNGVPYQTDVEYTVAPISTMTMTYPGGRQVTSSFDQRLRSVGVSSTLNSIVDVSGSWQYNPADELESILRGNTVVSNIGYDDNGRLTSIEHEKGSSSPFYRDEYGYDAVGNRIYTHKIHTPENSELYEYDALDRLTNFERGTLDLSDPAHPRITSLTNSPLFKQSQDWKLDARGNWLLFDQLLQGVPSSDTREVNSVNEYVKLDGQDFYAYDNNGNLLEDGDHIYEYDTENRLIAVKDGLGTVLESFRYDPLGLRVQSTDATGAAMYHLFLGFDEIQEHKADGTLLREYVSGSTGLFALVRYVDSDGQPIAPETFYYLQDILGSTVALTNVNGDIVENYVYEPYGETHILGANGNPHTASTFGNPFMWTGQRYNPETGLYHFFARSYLPGFGRWLQRDPAGYVDGVNLYEYVCSSPMNFVDPLGFASAANMKIGTVTTETQQSNGNQNANNGNSQSGDGGSGDNGDDGTPEGNDDSPAKPPWDPRNGEWRADKKAEEAAKKKKEEEKKKKIEAEKKKKEKEEKEKKKKEEQIKREEKKKKYRELKQKLKEGQLTPEEQIELAQLQEEKENDEKHGIKWDVDIEAGIGVKTPVGEVGASVGQSLKTGEKTITIALGPFRISISVPFNPNVPENQPKGQYCPIPSSTVCFVAGTKILTSHGMMSIEQIQKGDIIYSFDLDHKKITMTRVSSAGITGLVDELIEIKVDGNVIRCTTNHPFLTKNRGWIGAKNLVTGDVLQDIFGKSIPVAEVTVIYLDNPIPVYDVKDSAYGCFFVGRSHILTHSICNQHILLENNGK